MSATSTIGSSLEATTSPRGRLGQRVLRVVRVLLAIQFAAGGLLKLGGAEPMVRLFADIGAGQWLRSLAARLRR